MTRFLWILAIVQWLAAVVLFMSARGAMHETTSAVVGVGAILAMVGAIINGTLQKILVATRGEYQPPTAEEAARDRNALLATVAGVVILVVLYFVVSS